MFAYSNIRNGDEIASIPLKIVITEGIARGSELGKVLGKVLKDGRMIMYFWMLLKKRNENSDFYVYLKSLPKEFNDPLWWNMDDLKDIERSTLYLSIVKRRQELEEAWNIGIEVIKQHKEVLGNSKVEQFLFSEFLWAHSAFTSRAFPSKLAGVDGCGILLPGLDIMNHKYGVSISWILKENRIVFEAGPNYQVKANEEVFNNYGAKSNGEWLMGYGFSVLDNNHDYVPIVPKTGEDKEEHIYYVRRDHVPMELISEFRELHAAPFERYFTNDFKEAISLENESYVVNNLRTLFKGKLSYLLKCDSSDVSFEELNQQVKSFREDLLLTIDELSLNKKHAKMYILGQLEILECALTQLSMLL
jgi:hypothetical protein